MARTCFSTELCQGEFFFSLLLPLAKRECKDIFCKGRYVFYRLGNPKPAPLSAAASDIRRNATKGSRREDENTRLSRVSFRAKSPESNLKPFHISHCGSLSFMRETVFPLKSFQFSLFKANKEKLSQISSFDAERAFRK